MEIVLVVQDPFLYYEGFMGRLILYGYRGFCMMKWSLRNFVR